MIAHTLLTTVIGIAALTGATPTPAPNAGTDTVTVFSENVNNLVTLETAPTSERLATLHTHDVLQLVTPDPVTAAWGDFYNVVLPDGRTGWIKTSVVVPTPTTTEDDLTEASVVIAPSAGGGWLGQMAAGSSAAFTYPTTMSDRIAVPPVGTELDCAPFEVTGSAGILGDVAMTPCYLGNTIGYIRSEHIAPAVDLDEITFSGSTVAAGDTPVYNAPAATDETEPIALIPAGTEVETGQPTGAFTPVRFDGETGWAPTNVLMGIETLSDKIKDKAGVIWDKTKEIAGETKETIGEKLDEVEKPAAVTAAFDLPNLVLSLVLVVLTLGLAWVRKISVLSLPRIVRRGLNVAAIVPLLVLASIAPIASFSWVLWIVLAVTGAVSLGVFTGFKPDVAQTATVARTRKAQVIAGASVVGGALLGAAVTGFAGWLAPLSAAIVAGAAAAGYLLSAPAEKDDEPVTPDVPADAPTIETTEEVSA